MGMPRKYGSPERHAVCLARNRRQTAFFVNQVLDVVNYETN
jgi:hypothetical protein